MSRGSTPRHAQTAWDLGFAVQLNAERVTPFIPRERPNIMHANIMHAIADYLRPPRPTPAPALKQVLHLLRCWEEEPGYAAGNPPEDYGQIWGGSSCHWMIAVDYCFHTMPYTAFNWWSRSLMSLPGWGRKVLLLAIILVPRKFDEPGKYFAKTLSIFGETTIVWGEMSSSHANFSKLQENLRWTRRTFHERGGCLGQLGNDLSKFEEFHKFATR